MEKIKLSINEKSLRNIDATRIQNIFSELFSNFNGGFGWHVDADYIMRQYLASEYNMLTMSITDCRDYWDLYYSFLDHPVDESKVKSVRITIETALFEICKRLEIEYSPTSDCVDSCIKKCKDLNIPIHEFKDPVAK